MGNVVVQFGWTLLAACLVLGGIGHWADGRWGSEPWLTVVGVLLGIVVAFRSLFRELARWEAREKQRRHGQGPPGPTGRDGSG